MTLQLFRELRQDIDTLRGERDLMEVQLGVTQYRLMELIASIKALADLLNSKPKPAQVQGLIDRMIVIARRDFTTLESDEQAVCDLRKATGDD